MSAKFAQDSAGPIIYKVLLCGNRSTVTDLAGCEAGQTTRSLAQVAARFWSKVRHSTSFDECWPWTAHLQGGGYGAIRVAGKWQRAHRVAYLLVRGPIPSGKVVRHRCHNRACCNPFHLRVGTQKQNVHDAMAAGRHVNPDWRARRTVRNQHGYEGRVI